MPNDIIYITKYGVVINNHLLQNSVARLRYNNIWLAPISVGYKYKLNANEYWLGGSSANSYDSRYFGVVTKADITKRAILILPIK